MAAIVLGASQLMSLYRSMPRTMANKIARPAVRRAATQAAKIVKQSIPSRYKGVRRAIGSRVLTFRSTSKTVGAKVGAAVGKSAQRTTQAEREGRKGVGFDARNIHWWFMGTQERTTGTKRQRTGGSESRSDTGGKKRRTGSMPPQAEPVAVILAPHRGAIATIIRTWIAVGVKKEFSR